MSLTARRIDKKLHNYNEIAELMKNAFPKHEQFPLWLLRFLACRKDVKFTAYYDRDLFAGVSYSVATNEMVFLLFLAVNPHIRSKGYGSAILEIIKREHPDKVLTLNIEPLDCNADNYEQRKSRLAFYERNGFCVTDYVINDTGEDYTILSSSPNYAVEDFKKAVRKLSFGLYKPNIRKHR